VDGETNGIRGDSASDSLVTEYISNVIQRNMLHAENVSSTKCRAYTLKISTFCFVYPSFIHCDFIFHIFHKVYFELSVKLKLHWTETDQNKILPSTFNAVPYTRFQLKTIEGKMENVDPQ
jgi:hypothetical protein